MTRREITQEARRLLALAWPVALTSLQWILMNLTDTALVGRYSTAELGAMGAGRAIVWVPVVMGVGGLSGVLVFAGRADGAGERHTAGDALRQGMMTGFVFGVIASALIIAGAGTAVSQMDVAPELRGSATAYTRLLVVGLPLQMLFSAASFFMEGISRPRVAMTVNLASIPVNALLAWVLINGHLGRPPMGAAGAALGTVLTQLGSTVTLIWLVHRMRDAREYGVITAEPFVHRWRRAWAEGGELRRFAVAPALAQGFELLGFSLLMTAAAQQSAAVSGAFQAAISLHIAAMTAAAGLGSAAGVRVANAVGEGRSAAARPRTLIATAMVVAFTLIFTVLYLFAAPTLLAPFSDDAEVVALGAAMLRLIAPVTALDGAQYVFLYSLRSLGDQRAAGWISTGSFAGVMGLGGWWAAGPGGFGPLGLMGGVAVGVVVAAFALGARFWWRSARPVAG
jgi:MATE family multidrug resistance protein